MDYVTHPFFQYDVSVKDFIKRCLMFDQDRRLTVEQAMGHPLLQSYTQEGLGNMKWSDFPTDRKLR